MSEDAVLRVKTRETPWTPKTFLYRVYLRKYKPRQSFCLLFAYDYHAKTTAINLFCIIHPRSSLSSSNQP